MTNAMVKTDEAGGGQYQIAAYKQMTETLSACKELGASLQVTYGLNSPHHGQIMMLTCLSEGLSVSNYHKRYHPDGTMRASAIQAEFLHRGGVIEWEDIGDDGKVASAKFSHPKLQPMPLYLRYTIEDAQRQVGDKLSKDGSNWKTNPGAMLRAALIRKAIKIIDPGVIGGYDDFNDINPTPATVQVVSDSPVDDREARRQELLAQQTTAEEVIDVESTPKPEVEAKSEPAPEPAPEPATEPAPEPAAQNTDKVTDSQLQELAAVGMQFPSEKNAGQKMSIEEIQKGICAAANVSHPNEMTQKQAAGLLLRWRELLSQK